MVKPERSSVSSALHASRIASGLGVRRRIELAVHPVLALGEDLPVSHQDRAERVIAPFERLTRQLDASFHRLDVVHALSPLVPQPLSNPNSFAATPPKISARSSSLLSARRSIVNLSALPYPSRTLTGG